MRVQTLLNKNSKLNPSGGTRPPIRLFSLFFFSSFFLLQATAQKYLWLQRNMEKKINLGSIWDSEIWQRNKRAGGSVCPPGGSVGQACSTRGTCWRFWKLFPTNQPLWFSVHRPAWRHFNLLTQLLTCSTKTPHRELFMNCIRGLFTTFRSYWYVRSPLHPLLSNTFPPTFGIFHLFPPRNTKSFV